MDEEGIKWAAKEYLRKNLRIELDTDDYLDGHIDLHARLILEDDIISESSASISLNT